MNQQNGENEWTRERQIRPKRQAFLTQIGKQRVLPKDCLYPDVDGRFSGQGICFTGAIPGMSRDQARGAAAAIGFEIVTTVGKKCNVLMAGELDPTVFAEGATKSSKLLKAEARAAKSENIQIWSPLEFAGVIANDQK